MDNISFFNHLQNLNNDRFALSHLDTQNFREFRRHFLQNFNVNSNSYHQINASNTAQDWYLVGTDGCHLCHVCHALLTQTKAISLHMPDFYELDIIDGSDELIGHLGTLIPVLLTPTLILCYPFGVMDIMRLLKEPITT